MKFLDLHTCTFAPCVRLSLIQVVAGSQIPADGIVVYGEAHVDEVCAWAIYYIIDLEYS